MTITQNYPLAPGKIKVKREMSEYQLKIADLYETTTGSIKKLVANIF